MAPRITAGLVLLSALFVTTFQTTLAQAAKQDDLCNKISTLIEASKTSFVSILGETMDEKEGAHVSKVKLSGWGGGFVHPEDAELPLGSGWVYPEDEEPYALYIMLGGNRISEIRLDYQKWVSNLAACVPRWKPTRTASREEVETVFRQSPEGLSIGLKHNVKPDKGSDTKYDLYLTIQARGATQKASPQECLRGDERASRHCRQREEFDAGPDLKH